VYSEHLFTHGEALWRSIGSAGGATVPADGCVDVILRDGRVEVAGPSTRWLATGRDGATGSFGFRMQPGRARLLLGIDLAAIADQLVPLDDVTDRRTAARFREAMIPLEAGPAPVGTLEAFAVQLAASSRWSDAIRRAASEAAPARDIASTMSGSERSFRRQMLVTFGYGYATLVRLERSRRARTLLRSGMPIADVAAEAGYADQPHLSREFRRLVGSSPAQFVSSAA
jgi:AraC-like DNA-binding protein